MRPVTREQIRALPVEQLAAKDCALFCWFVDCHLLEALAAIQAWGFSFKTIGFTWPKQTKDGSKIATSQGHWSRRNTEKVLSPCAVGRRNSMPASPSSCWRRAGGIRQSRKRCATNGKAG